MGDDMNPRAAASLADVIDDDADLARGFRRAAERWTSCGRRVHRRGARRAAKARKIERPDVEAVALEVMGPRTSTQPVTDRQRRRERRAVNVQHRIAGTLPAPEQQGVVALAAIQLAMYFQVCLRRFSHVNSLGAMPSPVIDAENIRIIAPIFRQTSKCRSPSSVRGDFK